MKLTGRKKGGGTGPREAADSLRSTQVAELAILLSEGPCQGLVNGMKSVYLDGVPIENADGSRNFEDVAFAYTVGTQGQAALPGLTSVQSETAVALQIDQASPITRTITDPATDQVRVTIGVPQLSEQDAETGDLKGSSFIFAIEIQSNGAGFVEKYRGTVDGKTASRYSRAVKLDLVGAPPWDIRVRRISADSTSSTVVNRFYWDSFTSIQNVKLRYPNSAVSFLRVAAKTFGRVPTQSCDWMGLWVKLPSNYNPITRAYTGAWNGTFTMGWTNNPAWVLYDLVTMPRYGLGQFVDAAFLNKWVLYEIARYCDQLVSDGRGGQEPRFTCNVYIQTLSEAYNLLRDMAAIFRGMVFWANSAVDFAQDAPAEAEMLYTPANVVDGAFSYADSSERQLHSVFICNWNDMAQMGKTVAEVYTDPVAVARFGMRELHLQPLGCTSRGQANRAARWAAYSEQLEGEVVSFAVGADGVAAKPGRLFKIADPNEAGERLGGRIHSATTTQVTLDADVTLASGEAYALSVIQPSSTDTTRFVTEKRTVTTGAGTWRTLNVAPAFSAAPAAETVWLLESNEVQATWWRCLSVEEVAGKNEWRISGVAHNPGKFDLIEQGLKLDPRPISRLKLNPPKPASVSVVESPYLAGSMTRSRVTVSWPEPGRGLTYLVSWRLASGPWTDMPATSANSVEVDGLARGLFEVAVRSLNGFGNTSLNAEASQVLLGKTARPSNVGAFTAALVQGAVAVSWNPNTEDDYLTTEIRRGASWEAGVVQFEGAASKFTWTWPDLGNYTLWAKHFDTSLGESATAMSATVNVTSAVYVQWGDISGSGKPANGATADLSLVGRGVQVTGNAVTKTGGTGYWDADCYSVDSYVGGAFASAVVVAMGQALMFGLNTDPATDSSYSSIDFAWFVDGENLQIYESNEPRGAFGAYAPGDVLAVVFDGSNVRYLRNGQVLRTKAFKTSLALFFDSSFATGGASLRNLRFGPLSSNAWTDLGGKPADTQILNNMLNPAAWVPGTSGNQPGFSAVGTSSGGSNSVSLDVLPDGSLGPVWLAQSGRAAGTNSEGGLIADSFEIDPTKAYRFLVWMKVDGDQTTGAFYFGLQGNSVDDVGGSGAQNSNPYFVVLGRTGVPYGEWVLVVGYVYPEGHAAAQAWKGGVWRAQSGEKISSGADFRWHPGQANTHLRTFQYYTSVAGSPIKFRWPEVRICDGSEPSIDQLLAGAAKRLASQAISDAATAQGAANAANSLLADIQSDGKLTATEKAALKLQWDQVQSEKSWNDAQATAFGLTTEKTAYDDAYTALASLMSSTLASMSTTSDLAGDTLRSTFNSLTTNRQIMLNKIATEAAKRATWAQVDGVSVTTGQIAPGALTAPGNVPVVSVSLYTGSPVSSFSNAVVDGPAFTTIGGSVHAAISGRVTVTVNTALQRVARPAFIIQLIDTASGTAVQESGVFGSEQFLIQSSSNVNALGCSTSLIFIAPPPGSYKIRLKVSMFINDATGFTNACMTNSAFTGELSGVEFKR